MASFFSKLFGLSGGAAKEAEAVPGKTETYADCLIKAAPKREASQFRLGGIIEKDVDGQMRTRSFIRADVFSSEQDAIDAAFRKARQIIDQHGASLFADDAQTRQV